MHILLADADHEFTEAVAWYLQAEGWEVACAGSWPQAAQRMAKRPPQLLVLAAALAEDGPELLTTVQATAVLLTGEKQQLAGHPLAEHAAEVVAKPIGAMELSARIKALLHKHGKSRPRRQHAKLRLVEETREAVVNGQPVPLPPLEFALLKTLLAHPNTPQTRDRLAEAIWGEDLYGDLRLVDRHIAHLRGLLKEAGLKPSPIATVRGVGYVYRVE